MNVLLLSRYSHLGASSRLRTLQYLPHLKKADITVEHSSLLDDVYLERLYSGKRTKIFKIIKSYFQRLYRLFSAKEYDLIWIEKELFPWFPALAEYILDVFHIPYIVDYDDAIFHRYDSNKHTLVRILFKNKIDAVMRHAKIVTVGNDYLASRARKAGTKYIEYLPTVIDLDRYDIEKIMHIKKSKNRDTTTIGWIGTQVTVKYLELIAPVLAEVSSKRNIQVVVVGPHSVDLRGVNISVKPWSEATEIDLISDLDIGIMPLTNSPWEEGKCGYKLIQYMACGIPVVASPIGINLKIVDEGINGFLASGHSEWIKALLTLIDDKELAKKIGEMGRKKIEREFCIQVTAPKLVRIMQQAVQE